MLSIILIPALAVVLYGVIQVREARKHDRVLYRFCQIRRDVMDVLRSENQSLSAEDYAAGRRLLDFLNLTISLYREHRTKMFDWRAFVRFAREYRQSATQIVALSSTRHKALSNAVMKTGWAALLGFLAYTPFIKSETALRLTASAVEWLARIAKGKVEQRLRRANDFVAFVRDQFDRFGPQPA